MRSKHPQIVTMFKENIILMNMVAEENNWSRQLPGHLPTRFVFFLAFTPRRKKRKPARRGSLCANERVGG